MFFYKIKKVRTPDLSLAHYNPNKDIIVAIDSSDLGLGAVILHNESDS